MNDAEFLRDMVGTISVMRWGGDEKANRISTIATKYESMARAVLWAYDESKITLDGYEYDHGERMAFSLTVKRATGKHPSEWTRETLMKELGVSDGE